MYSCIACPVNKSIYEIPNFYSKYMDLDKNSLFEPVKDCVLILCNKVQANAHTLSMVTYSVLHECTVMRHLHAPSPVHCGILSVIHPLDQL